ncbi:PREDICTED: probable CCR4-associated factor 1 homolog 11 [Tarenaya hassleriana]|uniref:probable CCR4-associated factor 1 homolog 11 n=1 Tax=Tarenaya hassleriana TaxID=28532 RepID=UPI00053C37A0|nr:PREDICTED: probable CCR4-associated factor 1 homolog 11 [Tarenaya hassleriana]XP_010525705.1 PREDICTED: probable CCR4-associated factor 1 homolog 11 [Tarenaya hassleriana]
MQGPADYPPMIGNRRVEIRSVWAHNFEPEFRILRSISRQYPVIAMDTEFPGIVFRSGGSEPYLRYRDPVKHYSTLKLNVDRLKLIQIGISLSDEDGNLPDLGTEYSYIWEFNFKDFDVSKDSHASDSIELLRRQGIDFEKNLRMGIDSVSFAELMMSTGLVLNGNTTWVTFHCAYDFGYLVKCLTQRPLPDRLEEFLHLVRVFFGEQIYDVKHLMRYCQGLYGGLDHLGKCLGVERIVGNSHQAGSDSLLTLHTFRKIREVYFGTFNPVEKYANMLSGLELC